MMRWPTLLILALASTPTLALAQDQDAQLWAKAGVSGEISDGVALKFEMNQRLSDRREGLYESQYLAAISLDVADGVTLTGGMNRVVDIADGRVRGTEWRPRQQISFPITKIGTGELGGRVRFEQRFTSGSDDVGHRVRPEISYALPLGDRLDLVIAHESYFNFNTTDFGQDAGHERMRNSAALAVPISKIVDVEIGYLNQYRFNGDDRDLMEHALTTALSVSF